MRGRPLIVTLITRKGPHRSLASCTDSNLDPSSARWSDRAPAAKPGPRVLIVEDDDATREMLCTVLNEAGFDIVAAVDGVHALRSTLARRPQVILLDLGLPLLDGSGFLEQWRDRDARAHHVPVIVTSGSPYSAQIAEQLGAVRFIRKPFDLDELVATIRAHAA